MSGLPGAPNARVNVRSGTRPTPGPTRVELRKVHRRLAWLSPPLFDPGSYSCHKLFEGSLVYLVEEPEIEVALKEFFEDLKQRLFPDAAVPC